ncbi:hypothetical protein [Alteriqipengyuania lutimaris]|uniref:hypothetical protein n=1 Tax=Alteriqipengyuania lutimaris TaxID=1538146 RepID=UPI001CFEB0CE|nr:hypothetical protein [Alteriqipengyuania lutimaris]
MTDEEFDIVDAGFHAGVRLGEVIEQDMIAVPVGKDQRQIVVAAPAYLARAGAGLTIGMADTFAPFLQSGELRAVLEPYCPPLPGFFLFYPNRRHLPITPCALVDHLRDWRNQNA